MPDGFAATINVENQKPMHLWSTAFALKYFMIYREAKKKSNFACKGLCQLIVQLILLLPFLLKNRWGGHRTKELSILVSLKNTKRDD